MANQLIRLDDKHISDVQLQMGTKLDPPLISALVERWRPVTHTFHLPCSECTITLKDISLQLGLPVNGEVITGPMASVYWSATCNQLIGKVLNKFKLTWIPYADPRIQECVSAEFLVNHNIWQVKVPLIIFATVKIHESNQRRYDYLPMREPFLMPNLATSLVYMDWFRHNGKSYLLSTVEISRKHHRNRPRRGPINPRSVEHAKGDQYLL
ncbi:hypothetical protein Goari_023867 [Gossypium aridum]|uniref:Aminotransferase-like plant mobile domain-containing protein n=1 Tax=Gossypium aridum TaxID=34290 RepID=A0A7J8X4C5_GOSAI|nr:hypothetical protein [Gossypium aridum]